MDYKKLWLELKQDIFSGSKTRDQLLLLELMDRLESVELKKEIESNKNRTNLENNGLFEKSETGNYNPKPF